MKTKVSEKKLRLKILEISKRLYAHGWLAACDGNVSVKLDKRTILITPSGRPKAFIRADEIAKMDLNGKVLAGDPSSEYKIHLEVYQRSPKAKAVVHAHPPIAIAWTIAAPKLHELPASSCSELIIALGSVPFVPYARPGTQAMAQVLTPFLPKYRVLVMRNHGSLTWGEDLDEAYFGTERLEHAAKLLMFAAQLNGSYKLPELPAKEIIALKALRKKLGERII